MTRYLSLAPLLLLLTACGGSSDNNSSPPASSSPINTSSVISTPASSLSSSLQSVSSNSSSSLAVSSAAPSSQASSRSQASSNSSSAAATTAPAGLSATAAQGSVTLRWNNVQGATSYNAYVAAESGIIPANIAAFDEGRRIENVSSPYTLSGLQNGKPLYFVVTANRANVESNPSSEVSAIPTALQSALAPTAQEVLVIELINRARANPLQEAARYGINLNEGITGTPISAEAKPPLALNTRLQSAARDHSQWLLDNNVFSHTGINNSSVTDRIRNSGYSLTGSWATGENIALAGASGNTINLTQYAFEQHEGLFKSAGHRSNILSNNFREVGVGQLQGYYAYQNGGRFLSSMLTEVFARTGTNRFLTGVVYEDRNGNNFYDVGEGLSNTSIQINNNFYEVFSSGAYSIPLSDGTYTMTVHGLGEQQTHSFTINGNNLKRDVIKSGNAVNIR
ncbi:CAP domain-containing protein [Cellvibrio polysaccharolyticus]|uniref:CAP domain-containing protein n=1 Tax=Cellvibrio polysaccharolyticus TaxID=2082724 RepID=A0A928YUA9_9GAMM|nr:CAP domain-containing protein [Cellvibrio polysaccharolyticus]MBE8717255.1 CAP domain-containing protein [Cellvibrio polysaccharolyticus]